MRSIRNSYHSRPCRSSCLAWCLCHLRWCQQRRRSGGYTRRGQCVQARTFLVPGGSWRTNHSSRRWPSLAFLEDESMGELEVYYKLVTRDWSVWQQKWACPKGEYQMQTVAVVVNVTWPGYMLFCLRVLKLSCYSFTKVAYRCTRGWVDNLPAICTR